MMGDISKTRTMVHGLRFGHFGGGPFLLSNSLVDDFPHRPSSKVDTSKGCPPLNPIFPNPSYCAAFLISLIVSQPNSARLSHAHYLTPST